MIVNSLIAHFSRWNCGHVIQDWQISPLKSVYILPTNTSHASVFIRKLDGNFLDAFKIRKTRRNCFQKCNFITPLTCNKTLLLVKAKVFRYCWSCL